MSSTSRSIQIATTSLPSGRSECWSKPWSGPDDPRMAVVRLSRRHRVTNRSMISTERPLGQAPSGVIRQHATLIFTALSRPCSRLHAECLRPIYFQTDRNPLSTPTSMSSSTHRAAASRRLPATSTISAAHIAGRYGDSGDREESSRSQRELRCRKALNMQPSKRAALELTETPRLSIRRSKIAPAADLCESQRDGMIREARMGSWGSLIWTSGWRRFCEGLSLEQSIDWCHGRTFFRADI